VHLWRSCLFALVRVMVESFTLKAILFCCLQQFYRHIYRQFLVPRPTFHVAFRGWNLCFTLFRLCNTDWIVFPNRLSCPFRLGFICYSLQYSCYFWRCHFLQDHQEVSSSWPPVSLMRLLLNLLVCAFPWSNKRSLVSLETLNDYWASLTQWHWLHFGKWWDSYRGR